MPARRRLRRSTLIVLTMVALIVVAHVFLWRSDMATGEKLMWTAFNTVAWTIILAPVFLVDRWLDSIRKRDRPGEGSPAGHRARRR
ncbi:MAG: hypothetical protein ACOCYW_05775 [Roseicyclus sp.]